MKVVLVVPDSVDLWDVHPARTLRKAEPRLPLGVLYVAAAAEQAGHEVVVLDNFLDAMSEEDLLAKILDERPDCVGFSCAILNIWQAFALAAELKRESPETLTVFGGPQPTIDPEGTVSRQGVDCVVCGEGESAFVEMLDALGSGREALVNEPGFPVNADNNSERKWSSSPGS